MPDTLTGESLNLATILADPTNVIVAHLAQNASALDAEVIDLTGLVECNFPGYAPVQIIDPDVFETGDDYRGEAVSDPIVFSASDELVTPQNVTAFYLTWQVGSGAATLWRCYPLKEPFVFDVPGRKFPCQVRINSYDNTAAAAPPVVPGDA